MIAIANSPPKKSKRPLGVILHRGESPWTGAAYVVIAILGRPSKNEKTGAMIQTYILLADEKPTQALKTGADKGICGNCPMASFHGCYVNVGNAPLGIYKAFRNGRYVDYSPMAHDQYFDGRMIRWGAYGEPVLLPIETMAHLAALSSGWTGYTHQWRDPQFQGYRQFLMASVHGRQYIHATKTGWRWFHSSLSSERIPGAIVCPASAEMGKRLTCEECAICNGNNRAIGAAPRVSVQILTHGGFGAMHAAKKNPELN
jgi:hypothetical protein